MAGVDCSEDSLSDDIQGELEVLRSIYQGDGEFAMETCCHGDDTKSNYLCEVIIKPSDMPLGLSFSLPGTYPQISPRIEMVSLPESISQDNIAVLLVYLYQIAKENAGTPHLYSVVEGAKQWIRDHLEDLHLDSSSTCSESDWGSIADSDTRDKEKKKEMKKNKGKKQDDTPQFGRDTKKPPMKTATDVISRIQWDKQLNPEHFIVGYLDRFIGVVEQPFLAFYWGDIAEVDHLTLAIPRHRIQYFKYKDEVVWDKRIRLDNVFGSLGSGLTVVDVVQRYAKENDTERNGGSEKEVNDLADVEVDDDRERMAMKDGRIQRRRIDKSRPNYFIAIQITNEDIKTGVKQIQDHMTSMDPLVSSYLTSLSHLHVTLCMLQLASKAQINTALSVLKTIQPELASMLLPVTMMRFQGVDSFHDRIIYSPTEADNALEKMTHFLRTSLSKAGLSLIGTRDEFVPHLTIMKMAREEANGHPIFTSDLKSIFSEVHLGTQVVDAIHLCSIDDKPAHDRFYYSLAKVDLNE
nr:uncharacterized protein LOC129269251 [Lytechinus pictus]